jgi:hypothetical protein
METKKLSFFAILKEIPRGTVESIKQLNLKNRELTDIDNLNQFVAVTSIDLSNNKLKNADCIKNNTGLKNINLAHNSLG